MHSAAIDGKSKYRADIQGLRTVAVGVVVLYHVGVPGFSGGYVGVDVFFVISGFLITGLLLRELATTGHISLKDFWARRARRILPASAVTLVSVAILTLLILPPTRWISTGQDIVASAVYLVNWLLAAKSISYLSGNDPASPVQHFWSLAIEEQFYIIWPMLIIVLALIARRALKRSKRPHDLHAVVLVGSMLLLVPSLSWSIYYTLAVPGQAYFVTTTRLWELALGAGLASCAPWFRLVPRSISIVVGWLGLAAIAASAVLYGHATAFPGYAALVPTLGTAAIISATTAPHFGPNAILSLRPMVWVGDLSYSLYLWHWPLIVFATFLLGGVLPAPAAVVVIAISILLAILSRRYVEEPWMRRAKVWRRPVRRSLQLGVACMLIGVLAGGGIYSYVRLTTPAVPSFATLETISTPFGAEVLAAPSGTVTVNTSPTIMPNPIVARDDFDETCKTSAIADATPHKCEFGSAGAAVNVLLVGDSHLRQWLPALRVIAQRDKIHFTAYLKDACPFIDGQVSREGTIYLACEQWNRAVRSEIAKDRAPQFVITTNNRREGVLNGEPLADADSRAVIADGLRSAWDSFTTQGTPVIVIRDTPAPGFDVPECVSLHTNDLSACSSPKALVADTRGLSQIDAAKGNPLVTLIDMDGYICPTNECPAVIGGVLVYLDKSHLTSTYATSLADALETQVLVVIK